MPGADSGGAEPTHNGDPGTPTTERSTSGNLADLQDSEPLATCAILLPRSYSVTEGSPLWGGVKLGRLLGAGVQAKVFELTYNDGRPTGKVLKISHTDLGHKLLNNPVIWIGMEREWEIGTQLRAALQDPAGQLPGFMRVCDCLVRGDEGEEGGGRAAFSGMIMEKLNGWEVYKRIDTPEFHNIHYVREMLFQVFSALDRAQRKLGFHHADLGMRNIMEHYPRLWEEELETQTARNRAAQGGAPAGGGVPAVHAKLSANRYEAARGALPEGASRQAAGLPAAAGIAQPGVEGGREVHPAHTAGGCADCQQPPQQQGQQQQGDQQQGQAQPRPGVSAERFRVAANGRQLSSGSAGEPSWRQRSGTAGGACGKVLPRPGFSCNVDGSRLPLGPHVEFKIIDFGVAVFDRLLAQAAGGYESEEVMQRLSEVFTARHITFSGSQRSIEMMTTDAKKRSWHLLPTAMKNRFRVRQTPAGAVPVQSAASLQAAGLPIEAAAAAAAAASQPAAVPNARSRGKAERAQRLRSATLLRRPGEGLARASQLMQQSAGGGGQQPEGDEAVHANPQRSATKPLPVKQSPIEKMYRRFWQRKGDVFHLLLNMALVLDDRVWPKEDERDVQLFISLVHHVTGVRMRASFASEGEAAGRGLFGRLACASAPRVKGEDVGAAEREYGRWGKWHHWFRRMHIRAAAHLKPFNSGLLAGEALCGPFFGAARVSHAQLPVCAEQVFPRSGA